MWNFADIQLRGIKGFSPPRIAAPRPDTARLVEIIHRLPPYRDINVLGHFAETNVDHPYPEGRQKFLHVMNAALRWIGGAGCISVVTYQGEDLLWMIS
ncbi:hypothetical protein [Roseinatronobacter bogoriensis]|uniref:Uncharacterized protein n=1 Tax=Roseinatronobacter bogoriensis subsp. barguzinensis TaxID=441209 RepID=A0A2K8KA36_9RHOB|nr:hypothetical protein [Rhodobaca]ATX66307.1 hypothetical protein BG454_11180 [Rhodobaca barguzinensis]TDW40261.1 hypothetical protein LY39_01295 [Rhodobaca barguzinensis]